MTNKTSESPFTATRQDITNLKQAATEAAQDIASTAVVHADNVKSNLHNLASHAQEEGREQLDQAKLRFADLGNTFRDYVAERPFACLGAALAIGFLFGFSRRN